MSLGWVVMGEQCSDRVKVWTHILCEQHAVSQATAQRGTQLQASGRSLHVLLGSLL